MWLIAERRAFLRALTCALASLLCRRTLVFAAGASEENWLSAPLERKSVESSNLAGIGYNRSARVLEIEFRSGAVYRYREVPAEIYEGLLNAESKGGYFIRQIRGRYEFRRMNEPHP